MTGSIVNVLADKGYFFIKGEDNTQYFAHRSSLANPRWFYDIKADDAVTFDPDKSAPKGPRAEAVHVARLTD